MFHFVWENFFNFMVFTFLKNALNLGIFTHAPIPQSKLQVEILKIFLPQDEKGERNHDSLY